VTQVNRRITLAAYPQGVPQDSDFALIEEPLAEPGPGQMLCRTLYLSLDPYMRVPILAPDSHVPRSGPPLALGDTMIGGGVCEVLRSQLDGFRPGDIVVGRTGWQTHLISDGSDVSKVDPGLAPISTAVGVLGMPGFTAYVGLKHVGRPRPGETVVVSAASGAVGSVVGQLARIWGCRAVGIAGAPEKCEYVRKELGFDACVSYRSASLADELARACPDGIDVYFENVGGEVLEAVLPNLNVFARIPVCGRISHLNEAAPPLTPDRLGALLGQVLTRRLTVQGFGQADFDDQFDAFVDEVGPLVASGRLRYREDVVEGFENAPAAFRRLFESANFGKLLVHVADPGAAG
jgi:NADPH-dependent curcumin reductase CurA